MASARDLKKKIRSISNTKKITRTMEMVATVKSKRGQDQIKATTPYSTKLSEILASLSAAGSIEHPFLKPPEKVETSIVLVITGNRGLCGGYNTNILALAERWMREEESAGRKIELHVVGKKGLARFRFLKRSVAAGYTHIDDNPRYQQAEELAEAFMGAYLEGRVQRVMLFAFRYFSAAVQRPVAIQLLPIPAAPEGGEASATKAPADKAGKASVEFIFEPDREAILKSLLPLSVKNAFYRVLVEAAASEQLARRVAMKLATDNAGEMIKAYTRRYNRSRQAGITQQIMEIVAGADALG